MKQFERGQAVTATNKTHGSHSGVVAVISTNGQALGILLDEPMTQRLTSGGMMVAGALMFNLEGETYTDFFGEEWDVVAQERPS